MVRKTRVPQGLTWLLAASCACQLSLPGTAQASTLPPADFSPQDITVALSAHSLTGSSVVPGLSVDFATSDRLSAGASTNLWGTTGRLTYRLLETPGGFCLAAVGAAGLNHNFQTAMGLGPFAGLPVGGTAPLTRGRIPATEAPLAPGRTYAGIWAQPALAASLPLGGPDGPVVVRAMIGPMIGFLPASENTLLAAFAAPFLLLLVPFGGAGMLASVVGSAFVPTVVLVPNLELAIRPTRAVEVTLGGDGLMGVRLRF